MSHTPGPWRQDHHGVRDRGGYICALNWPQHYQGQDDRYATETGQRNADARLIAAAPDLLAALQMCRDELAEALRVSDSNQQADNIDACMIAADSAIAKATGETK